MTFLRRVQDLREVLAFVGPKTRRFLLISILVGVLWFLIETAFVFILQVFLVTLGLLPKGLTLLPDWVPTSPLAGALLLIGFGASRSIVGMMKIHCTYMIQQWFQHDVRRMILVHGFRRLESTSTKELLSLFTEVVGQAGQFIMQIAVFAILGTSATLFFLYGLYLAPREMLAGMLMLAALVLPLRRFGTGIREAGQGLTFEWERLTETMVNGFRNLFFIRVTKQVDDELQKGEANLARYLGHFRLYSLATSTSSSAPLLIGTIVVAIVSSLGLHVFQTKAMTLVAFFYVFIRLAQATSEGVSLISYLRLNWPGLQRLMAWQRRMNTIAAVERRMPETGAFVGRQLILEFKDVEFSYGSTAVLSKFSYLFRSPGFYLIRGPSGSGKSTLIQLLLKVIEPIKGSVTVNNAIGIPVDYYERIAYVSSDPFLVGGTIRQNLVYGLTSEAAVGDLRMTEVLHAVELEAILRNRQGLNTKIGEIPELSMGQKQRLAIARALLRDPLLLVLDEATSNIDQETETRIIEDIIARLPGALIIAVSHRPSLEKFAREKIDLSLPESQVAKTI